MGSVTVNGNKERDRNPYMGQRPQHRPCPGGVSWDPQIGMVQATAPRGRSSSSRSPDRFLSFWNDLLGEDTNLALFVSFGGGPEDECIQP